MTSYDLSRAYFDWCFENPEKVSPNHTAIYFFAIEHCNRLGWKEKFGFPTQMAMDAIGIKKNQTYIRYFNDLVTWGFFKLIEKSKNQYSANIISLQSAMPKNGKALDKALIKHTAKQTESIGLGIRQSNSPIDKPLTKNKEQRTKGVFTPPSLSEVEAYFSENGYANAKRAFEYYQTLEWHDSKGNKVKNWKIKMQSVWFKDENKAKPQMLKLRNPMTEIVYMTREKFEAHPEKNSYTILTND